MNLDLNSILIAGGIILLISVLSSKLLYRLGIPTLIIFLTLGMILGSEGIGGIYFDNYNIAEKVASFGLIFIIFYGGMGMNWKSAKPIAVKASLLSSIGVVITCIILGVFSSFVLNLSIYEGLLLGAIVSSTDAAAIFSILRSRNLNLKNNLAPMLEMESASNDPMAYMLTIIFISVLTNQTDLPIFLLLFKQMVFGVIIGALFGVLSSYFLKKITIEIEGLYPIFIISVVFILFAFSSKIGGNGYLAIYITGIILGNSSIPNKYSIVRFFDGMSWLMQIILFFTLGLLVFPSQLLPVILSGLIISLFLIFVARPIAIFGILSFFKVPMKQQIFISWVGLRGAASIVFATFALKAELPSSNLIFNTVFFIALFSVIIQGSFIPLVAKKLKLIGEKDNVMKTFTDYVEDTYDTLLEIDVKLNSPLIDKTIMELNLPENVLIIMIKRKNKIITPRGTTQINLNDKLVLTGENKDDIIKYMNPIG
ncbi:MAG TPA: potassium/proton antiporter [Bacilli bacterium]|nr:potassium/proton antiporter [Bacilli bacterium]